MIHTIRSRPENVSMPDGVEALLNLKLICTKKIGNSSCYCQLTARKYVGYDFLYVEYNSSHSHP